MTRIHIVEKASRRKEGRDPFKCYHCHQAIELGTSYEWVQPSRYSARINWHATCPRPRPSMLEANEKRSAAMAAFEDFELPEWSVESTPDSYVADLKAALEQLAGSLGEVAEMWRESAQAIEDGFQHPTYQSDEYNEYADEIESTVSELEDWDPSTSEPDIDEDLDVDDRGDAFDAWAEEVRDEAQSAAYDAEGDMP